MAAAVFTSGSVTLAHAAPTKVGKPAVAFLGDSYTAGTGDPQYWRTTSALMCWDALNFGKRGTGYLNPGRKSGAFGSRVDAVVLTRPTVVIIQGSYNDKDPAAVEPAAAELFSTLRQRLPRAELFAMSPVSRPKPGSDELVAANTAAVRRAAAETGIKFIDARDFVTVDPAEFRRDLTHPNAAGHKMIGKRLAASLPKRLNACDLD